MSSRILVFFFLNLYIYFTLVNGDVCFDAERDSNQDCCHNNNTVSVILCLSKTTLLVLSFNLIDSLFSEIVLILYFIFYCDAYHQCNGLVHAAYFCSWPTAFIMNSL